MPVYTLPDLPYDHADLAPHVSAQVMQLHHGKHHQGYVDGANRSLERLAEERSSGADPLLVAALERAVAFHVGGHLLHSLFWTCMTPGGSGDPSGDLGDAIDESFGSLTGLRAEIGACIGGMQGSGWAVLSWEPVGQRLVVQQVTDHQGQVVVGAIPLLVVDAWEHAFYLDHLNDKAAWVDAFFEVADWSAAHERFRRARRSTSDLPTD